MYGSHLEKLVNNVDGHVESLLEQLELGVDLHQPVNQQAPHLPGDGTAAVTKSKHYTHTVMTVSLSCPVSMLSNFLLMLQ